MPMSILTNPENTGTMNLTQLNGGKFSHRYFSYVRTMFVFNVCLSNNSYFCRYIIFLYA